MTRKGIKWSEEKRKYPLIEGRNGVLIRLRPVGPRKVWHVAIEIGGTRAGQRSLKTRSLSIATIAAEELAEELAAGRLEIKPAPPKSPQAIYHEFIAWGQGALRPRTLEGYRYQVRLLLDRLKPASLENITQEALERYKRTITDDRGKTPRKVSNATIDRHIAGISAFLEFAKRQGYLQANPARGLRKESRKGRNSPDPADRQEIARILAVEGEWRVPVALAFYAGLRLSEIVHLEWSDVNLRERRLTVRAHGDWKPKSHFRRTIPLNSDLAAYLEAVRPEQRQGRVWADGATWRFNKPWRAFLKAHELPSITCHQLRHSFGTYLAAANQPIRNIQQWMGHADIKTTMVYMSYVPGAEAGIEALRLTEL